MSQPLLATGIDSELLQSFNAAGVLSAADARIAARLAELGGESDERVVLAAALAVRATRLRSVLVDLGTIAATATVEGDQDADPAALAWPEPSAWHDAVAASSLTADGGPLRLEHARLYLHRLWQDEVAVARDLLAFDAAGLLKVIVGGPGTGKTWTIAGELARLEQAALESGRRPPVVALAAPTGKAASRMQELVRERADEFASTPRVQDGLRGARGQTIHRLLGSRPDSETRFRHNRANKLPHDAVIIDETSMVPLPLMARVLEAVRVDAELILVGDPDQLASVEAGAVLADIVGPLREAGRRPAAGPGGGEPAPGDRSPVPGPFGRSIIVLSERHRYGERIDAVAAAVRGGDAVRVAELLSGGDPALTWIEHDVTEASDAQLAPLREAAVTAGTALYRAAEAGEDAQALAALRSFMVLCAHRRGPHGVSGLTETVTGWLAAAIPELPSRQARFIGQPLLVTANDPELGLYNGETGVVARDGAVFDGGRRFAPERLDAVVPAYALTIHKSQGSQFDTVAVILPPPQSRILTRELLYTALTRAMSRVIVVGSHEALTAAVQRPITRATGLRERLWEGTPVLSAGNRKAGGEAADVTGASG